MYAAVRSRNLSIPDAYSRKLVEHCIMTEEEIKEILTNHNAVMSQAFKEADKAPVAPASAKFSQVGQAQAKLLGVSMSLTLIWTWT